MTNKLRQAMALTEDQLVNIELDVTSARDARQQYDGSYSWLEALAYDGPTERSLYDIRSNYRKG